MRILHLYKAYAPVLGGIENHIRALAEAQSAEGHQVRVLVTTQPGMPSSERLNGVDVERAPSLGTLASTPLSPALIQSARSARVDLIHLHAPYPVAEVAVLGRRNAPYVITLHADPTRPVQRLILAAYAPLFRRVVDGARALLVTSPQAAHRSRWVEPGDPRIAIVPLGSDPERFRPTASSPNVPGSPLRILFTGMLRHYKGVDVLLKALPLITHAVSLTVAGAGPELERLRALSRQLDLSERVSFLGRIAEDALPTLYQTHDLFVLPAVSAAEAFGQVLVEAMLSGLPCITTELGTGTSFVVQDGVTGRVVEPRSPEALATTIDRLAAEPELRRRLGRAGRDRALEHFTTARMLADVRAVYAGVVSGGGGSIHEPIHR